MQAIPFLPTVQHPIEVTEPSAPVADRPVTLAELMKREPPAATVVAEPVREIGGRRDGPEPTRFGDWEKNGRCIDF